MKRYLLKPGPVRSRHDGEIHWIGAKELARLYDVPFKECVIWNGPGRREDYSDELIVLRPDYYGNYNIPTSEWSTM